MPVPPTKLRSRDRLVGFRRDRRQSRYAGAAGTSDSSGTKDRVEGAQKLGGEYRPDHADAIACTG